MGDSTTQAPRRGHRRGPGADSKTSLDVESRKIKAQHGQALAALQELFPTWSEEDLLAVIGDVNGDVEAAVSRIAEGMFLFNWLLASIRFVFCFGTRCGDR